MPQRKWVSSRLEGRTSWIFSSCARSLDLRRGPQGHALVASGKASPHASCSGASRDVSPSPMLSWILTGLSRTYLRVDQGICGFHSRLSHEAFPRGFPTGLSHVPPWCESILCLKVEAVQGKPVSLKWTEKSGVSGNGGTTLEFLSPFLWRAPPLEMRRERRKFFPDHAGKGSFLST